MYFIGDFCKLIREYMHPVKKTFKGSVKMESVPSNIIFGILPILLFIVYGVVALMGIYCLYLLIKLLIRAIKALDIHLDEKKNKYL